jgi:putative phosphonate catabolism associated alcohol dehydrogenase
MSSAQVQIFDGPDISLRSDTIELPHQLETGAVLVEILLATICGSDMHTISGQRSEPTPLVLGHEAVGRVVAIGGTIDGLAVDDRITWTIADSCGACSYCKEYALPEKCERVFKYGHAPVTDGTGLNGCYASHIMLRPGTTVVKIPVGMPDAVAAPANCALSTVCNAVSRMPSTIRSAVVQGAGMLGLYACAYLKEMGVEHVFCSDINIERLSLVADFGGIPLDIREESRPVNRANVFRCAPDGVDVVLEMAGASQLVAQGLELMRTGGYYSFVGMVHPNSPLPVTGEQIIRKCVTIQGIHNYSPVHLQQGIEFLEKTRGHFPYDRLVSPAIPLSRIDEAVALARTQKFCRVAVAP